MNKWIVERPTVHATLIIGAAGLALVLIVLALDFGMRENYLLFGVAMAVSALLAGVMGFFWSLVKDQEIQLINNSAMVGTAAYGLIFLTIGLGFSGMRLAGAMSLTVAVVLFFYTVRLWRRRQAQRYKSGGMEN